MLSEPVYCLTAREYAVAFAVALAIGVAVARLWDRFIWGRNPRHARIVAIADATGRRLRDVHRDLCREAAYADRLLADPDFAHAERMRHFVASTAENTTSCIDTWA